MYKATLIVGQIVPEGNPRVIVRSSTFATHLLTTTLAPPHAYQVVGMASSDQGGPSSNTRSFSVDEVIDMMDSFYDDMGMEMDDLNEPVYAGSYDDLEPELER